MAVTLTVNGVPYSFPESGELNWGEDVTSWAEAITDQLGGLVTTGDIALTTVNIADNQATEALVPGLTFDIANVKGAFVDYHILRSDDTNESPPTGLSGREYSETGTLILTYNANSATWDISRYFAGASGPGIEGGSSIDGVEFFMSNSGSLGQVYYKSDSMGGTNYSGKMRFRARVIK